MFSQYEPNVKATIAFLKLLNVKVNSATVDENPAKPSGLARFALSK